MMRPTTTKARSACLPSVVIWMGDASGGRSATSPTFFKSTSVRTRIDLQYSHTVCTLLDQRKATGAPQLGQLEVVSVTGAQASGKGMHFSSHAGGGGVRAFQAADAHRLSSKYFFEARGKVPVSTRTAAEQVQAQRTMFRKCVAGEVRFGKKAQPGDPARFRKLPPLLLAAGMQGKLTHHAREQRLQHFQAAQRFGTAT